MLRDEIEIEYRLFSVVKRLVMRLQHPLHDALEGRDIAADADLAILAGDPRLAKGRHLDRILRCRKPFECALAQRVDTTIGTLRRDARCSSVSIRGLLVPGFWPI